MNSNITIVCLETRDSEIDCAARTIAHCQNIFPCQKAILFTHKNIKTDSVENMIIPSINEERGYDRFVLSKLVDYIDTTHYLVIQSDGYIKNPPAWQDSWLQYDYIGAPWKYSPYHDWPPHAVVGPNTSVGNGGFSLRSRNLGKLVKALFLRGMEDPNFKTEHWYPEDCFICRDMRPVLETYGNLKFATEEVATQFSCENKLYTGQLGFHGKLTMEMNNIKYL